jgi:hypothetical protein
MAHAAAEFVARLLVFAVQPAQARYLGVDARFLND